MWARWLWRILAVGSCFPILPLAAGSPLIETVRVDGTRRPVDIETRAGQALDETRIERDVRRLWGTGWFDDIRVESSEAAEGIQLVFRLVERPRLHLRRIEFKPAREHRPVNLEKGQTVDAVLAKHVAAKLRRQLLEEAYAGASVEAEIRPVGLHEADLDVRVERGRAYRVREVRLSGPLGLGPKELEQALRSTRPRRLLPGLGRLWQGWRLLQPFSEERVQSDVERVRSLYFSKGYFDARVTIGAPRIEDRRATVTLEVDSGRRYDVRHLEVAETGATKKILPQPDGGLSTKALCQCLLEARREAERRGELNFSAQLDLRETPAQAKSGVKPTGERPLKERAASNPWVDMTAKISNGPAYRVGRIEFSGHRTVSDSTLRRALLLNEGDVFDQERLRRSLARLGQLGFLEPVTTSDVETELSPDDHRADLKIRVKEIRGRWSLSGPLGSVSVFGPPQFTIRVRLLPLGRGPAELSTYYATFSLLPFPGRWLGLVASAPRARWRAFGALERPYLPGQTWQSGFLLSPQLRWRQALAGYGLIHALQALQTTPAPDFSRPSDMSVPAFWHTTETGDDRAVVTGAGVLDCKERKPFSAWLRTASFGAMNVAANWFVPALVH